MMCDRDCFHCIFEDCICDELTHTEVAEQDHRDMQSKIDNMLDKELRVLQSRKKYASSEKGKANHKRYLASEKGKIVEQRRYRKRITSGRNAEACKRYYYRKKKEITKKILEGGR